MEFVLFSVIFVLLAAVGFLFYRLSSPANDRGGSELHQRLDLLNQHISENLQTVTKSTLDQLNQVTKQLNDRLRDNTELLNKQLAENALSMDRSHRTIGDRLDNAAKAYNNVNVKLSQLEEANKKIFDVGKDIASLQDILRAPKLRGGLGELFLGDLLKNILPSQNYSLQYAFSDGTKVDAVIHLNNNLKVPVDAKFPLENFKKMMESDEDGSQEKHRKAFYNDVRKHISDIAKKYILPDENTFDFALMYIPAENVYYETIIKNEDDNDVISFALEKRVIPVSPNTFYIYLQSILMGLRGFQIESQAQEIWRHLNQLKNDFGHFEESFNLLGKHLNHAKNSFDISGKQLDRFGQKLLQSADERPKLPEVEVVEKVAVAKLDL